MLANSYDLIRAIFVPSGGRFRGRVRVGHSYEMGNS